MSESDKSKTQPDETVARQQPRIDPTSWYESTNEALKSLSARTEALRAQQVQSRIYDISNSITNMAFETGASASPPIQLTVDASVRKALTGKENCSEAELQSALGAAIGLYVFTLREQAKGNRLMLQQGAGRGKRLHEVTVEPRAVQEEVSLEQYMADARGSILPR